MTPLLVARPPARPSAPPVPLALALLAAAVLAAGCQKSAPAGAEGKKDGPAPATAAAPAASTGSDTIRYPAGAPQLDTLKVAPAQAVPLPALEALPGRLVFDEDHTVRVTSPINGRALSVSAEPGTAVTQGQTLARLDSPDYAQAQADVTSAGADLALKSSALSRNQELYGGGVVARKDLEAARAEYTAAQAEATRASERLKELGSSAGGGVFVLRAPQAGIVAERHINPGQQVRSDDPQPLFTITDPNYLWLTFDVPEKDIGKVKVGQKLTVRADAYPDTPFEATVDSVGVTLDAATRLLPVRAKIPNADGRLHPEMFVRVTPEADSGTMVIVVPNAAVVADGLYSTVWVETAPGQFQRRRVTLASQGRDTSYVSQGLKPGERVVTSGALLLQADAAGG